MITAGRYALVGLRQFGRLELEVAEFPHTGFPNAALVGGPVGMYKGSTKKELAAYFLKFLASEAYNTQLVRDGHGIPPNPRYAEGEAFLRPRKFPNEWGLHEFFIRSAETVGIGISRSPFVLPHVARRIERGNYEAFLAGRLSAEETAAETARSINLEIGRFLERYPEHRPAYEALVTRQAEIDDLRAAGTSVPLEWIINPFHRKYYPYRGWAKE
jgi:ABC-type glycerol-3-phosphate transport system substrate-binding protein